MDIQIGFFTGCLIVINIIIGLRYYPIMTAGFLIMMSGFEFGNEFTIRSGIFIIFIGLIVGVWKRVHKSKDSGIQRIRKKKSNFSANLDRIYKEVKKGDT